MILMIIDGRHVQRPPTDEAEIQVCRHVKLVNTAFNDVVVLKYFTDIDLKDIVLQHTLDCVESEVKFIVSHIDLAVSITNTRPHRPSRER